MARFRNCSGLSETSMAKIVEVEVIPVAMPADKSWFESGLDETLVVRLTDENGVQGIGDCYASPAVTKPWFEMTSMHLWSRNLTSILKGADPMDRATLWDEADLRVCGRGLLRRERSHTAA